ncbi:MAG: NAD(P)-dependent oxidoreductase [bacterium]
MLRGAHCAGAFLVVACAPPAVNAAVAAAAGLQGALVCRADDPEHSDVHFPAVVRHGPVVASLSTGAPAATAALRGTSRFPIHSRCLQRRCSTRRRLAGRGPRRPLARAGLWPAGRCATVGRPPRVVAGWIAEAVAARGEED